MDDKASERAFFELLGRFSASWGLVEAGLDYATVALFDIGGHRFENRLPRVLSGKVSFIERCLTEIPGLSGISVHGISVMADVTSLSDRRHDLIHGVITSHPSGFSEKVSMVRLTAEKTHYLLKRVEVTPTVLKNAIDDATILGGRTLDLAKMILDVRTS